MNLRSGLLVILLVFSCFAQAALRCDDVIQLMRSPSKFPFGDKRFQTPDWKDYDLVPPSILNLLSEQGVRETVRVIREPFLDGRVGAQKSGLYIEIMYQDPAHPRRQRQLMKVSLIADGPGQIEVSGLVLNSPRTEATTWNDAQHTGWTLQETQWAFQRLQQLAKEMGGRTLRTAGAQTHSVAQLYQRMGFKPDTNASKDLYRNFEEIYRKVRKFFPEELKPRTGTEFQNFLDGDPLIIQEARLMWEQVRAKPDERWNSLVIHKDDSGTAFAITFFGLGERHDLTLTRILNLDPQTSTRRPFLSWEQTGSMSFQLP